jgi:2-hydroxychromene-2-carboxylate isomerase
MESHHMRKHLDFFLFLGSTYTYLAVNRAEALAAREGICLLWRPFSVRSIMIEQNNRPFVGKPAKLAYMWRDLERRAQRHGLPFASTPDYPIDADELANRVATLAAIEGWCPAFSKAAYRVWFLENKDPGRIEHVCALLEDLGRNPGEVVARANSQAIRDRYAEETAVARSLGIFGSPTFVCGSELFWGDDRLEDAIDWCKSH